MRRMSFDRWLLFLILTPTLSTSQETFPTGPEFRVNTFTSTWHRMPAVSTDTDGNFAVVWVSDSQDGSGRGVYGRLFASDGSSRSPEFLIPQTTGGDQVLPAIRMHSNGDFVVTWSSFDGSSRGVFARRYASDGEPRGGEFRVNTYTAGLQRSNSLEMDQHGNFIIPWDSVGPDGIGSDIYAQRYSSSGALLGERFLVNTWTTSNQQWASVGARANGEFVIAWNSFEQDGSNFGIFAQRFASDGTALGGEFQVNEYTSGGQVGARVAVKDDGSFVIVWHDGIWATDGQDGSGFGIYARRYDENGAPLGSEFQVNEYTTGNQLNADVSGTLSGGFQIIWDSLDDDGLHPGIYSRRYGPDGVVIGSEFRVDSSIDGYDPEFAIDSEGESVFVYMSIIEAPYQIYARRFALPADLELGLTAEPSSAASGESVTFRATVEDLGPSSAIGTRLLFSFAPETQVEGWPPEQSCTLDNQLEAVQISCELGELPVGVQVESQLEVRVPETIEGLFAGSARVASDRVDLEADNNAATAQVIVVPASPTSTATATPATTNTTLPATMTPTATANHTSTATMTATESPSMTSIPSASAAPSSTGIPSRTNTLRPTDASTSTGTATHIATNTPPASVTQTGLPTLTSTPTDGPTLGPSAKNSPTPSLTPVVVDTIPPTHLAGHLNVIVLCAILSILKRRRAARYASPRAM